VIYNAANSCRHVRRCVRDRTSRTTIIRCWTSTGSSLRRILAGAAECRQPSISRTPRRCRWDARKPYGTARSSSSVARFALLSAENGCKVRRCRTSSNWRRLQVGHTVKMATRYFISTDSKLTLRRLWLCFSYFLYSYPFLFISFINNLYLPWLPDKIPLEETHPNKMQRDKTHLEKLPRDMHPEIMTPDNVPLDK